MTRKTAPPEGAARLIPAALFAAIAFLAILGVLLMADHAPLGFVAVVGALVVAWVGGVFR